MIRFNPAFGQMQRQNEADFNRLLQSAVMESNSDFSGYLPQLDTDDESLWQLYHPGFKNLIFVRRPSPDSKYGTTYITLESEPAEICLNSTSVSLCRILLRVCERTTRLDPKRQLVSELPSIGQLK
jgi:hypothetical protein